MSKVLLTIAIPVFNRAERVEPTLKSVAAQTYRPLKVILVDNNSTDNTLKVLNEWKVANQSEDFIIDILTEKRPGASAARNTALKAIDTEWTMFFDSDDVMPANHIEKAIDAAMLNGNYNLVGWNRRIHRLNKSAVIRRFATKNWDYENLTHSILSTQSYMAHTELFRRAGGWDETLTMGDDIELGSRILQLNPKIYILSNHTVDVIESHDSITHTTEGRFRAIAAAIKKIRLTLPEGKRHWADLQLINMAATWAKSDPESAIEVSKIIAHTPFHRRLLWKFLYYYQLKGGRGAARIYALLEPLGF